MTVRLPRFISTLCLSIVLISSGTAWALQNCLMDVEALEHAHISNDEFPGSSGAIEHQRKPASKVHCHEYNFLRLLSLGTVSSVFRLGPSSEEIDAFLTAAPMFISGEFSDHTLTRSIKPHRSPHLFLPKLRI